MPVNTIFDRSASAFASLHSGLVVSVADPLALGRVQIRLLTMTGFDTQESLIWARVAVPFAGADYGAFLLPGIDDEVVVSFLNGDPRYPVVIGSLWHGSAKPTETLPKDEVDRWTFTGKHGSRIAIEEPSASDAKISFTLPNGVSGVLSATGYIEFKVPQSVFTMNAEGIRIQTNLKVEVVAATSLMLQSPQVTVNCPYTQFHGAISCTAITTNSVVSATYSVGAGNVW